MTFLTLNGTTIRTRMNAADQTDEEHRLDRERMFDGTIRMTRAGIFRKWSVSTAFLDANDRDTVRALVNGGAILTASGDLIGDDTPVMPVPGTWTPVQTGDGQRWQGKFALMETGGPLPPDRTANPWAFYQRGIGYWQDNARTVPALDGDPVFTWDDKSTNGRHGKADGTGFTGDDLRPFRANTDELHFGVGPGSPGAGSGRQMILFPSMAGLADLDVMLALRATLDPPATGNRVNAFTFNATGTGGNISAYPQTTGHLFVNFGESIAHDLGDPASDLTSYHVLNMNASSSTGILNVYFDNVLIFTNLGTTYSWGTGAGENIGLGNIGNTIDLGWEGFYKDVLIVNGILTEAQRRSWFDYFRGATTEPPLPI